MSLHTSENCSVDGEQSGTWVHHDCSPATPFSQGCGVQSNTDNSFGTGFNSIRGGVYAALWDSHGIQIWFFPRDKIPKDISAECPKPENWGIPQANFSGSCDFNSHFKSHSIVSHKIQYYHFSLLPFPRIFRIIFVVDILLRLQVLDVTFCGDWAGNVWQDSGWYECLLSLFPFPRDFLGLQRMR